MDYSDFIGHYCVVRARDASPHAGIIEAIDGRTVKMREARRLWRWRVIDRRGISLSEVAEYGIDAKEWSRVGAPKTTLIQDACEVILCSAKAEKTLRAIKVYRP